MTNDQPRDYAQEAAYIRELNASGYAGITREGRIVDRREYPKAYPIATNSLFGIAPPKPLPPKTSPHD